jgi:hypothetical protein
MINGEEYAFEDLQGTFNGLPCDAIQEVEYTAQKDYTEVYGRGAEPHTLGRGKKSYDAKIVVLQSFVEGIQRGLPRGKDLTDVPVELTISYAPEGGVITTDQITRGRITKITKGFKNGDGNMVVELPIKTPKILYNI